MSEDLGKMSKKKDAPEIRFPGFTDAWEQRGFSSVFEILQNNTLSRADLSDESGLAQNIHYGDVLIKYGEVLDVGNEPLAYINSEKIVTAMKNSYLQNGDVIIADTAEDTAVGKCSEIANLGEKTVLSGLHTIPVRPKEKYASGYLGYYLNSNSYHDTLMPLMQGTKVTSISKSALQGTSISYPKSIDEQAKISAYFQNLDHLITLHQRKLDKLHKYKKAMLQKMFPQNGADVPEIRFPGFTDAWEQRKFGSMLDERREKTISENEDTLLSCAIEGMFLNTELFSHFRGSSNIGYLKIKQNDLILSAQNLHLGNCNVNLRFKHGIISPAYKVYGLVNCNPLFVQAWVKQDSTKDFFLKATTEGASACRKNVVWDELYKQELFIPSLAEQQKIGEYFTNLDRLITLHQRKCEMLQKYKKAMLQKMFV